MIKPKKPIAFVCAAALLLSPTGALGASPSDFVDFPNDWSQGAMTAAVENGLLGGVGDGRIAPRGEVTRAQMAAIINRAFGAEKQASLSSYSDVAADAWYAVDMAKAVQMGTFSGTGNGLLEPDRAITREEAFSVLARAFALEAGDDSSLASFSDGAQVSSWAKGSVSAMVAAGYVNGSDGNRLNPQQTITRAEFAAVMSKIVAQYIDADSTLNRSLEIDGNVIVRGNVDLSGYTINGDVIIADEATNVTLDGVTVNGRLVVRGASDSLTISGSTADGVIITNPNGASVLKADNASDLGTVTALGDLTLSGGQLDRLTIAESATITVEKDASVSTITVSADDVTINGAGKVEKVQANADNVHVNVEDAEVTAGKGTSGVTAGDTSVAPGESVTVSGDSDSDNDNENTGSNTGNGGSSGGNNNNPGGSTDTPGTDTPGGGNDNPGTNPGGGESTGDNTNPGGSEETPAAAIINAETTKLVDLGWSQYVTVQFTKGHTLDNTILTIDGTDVTKAFTPVTDDGSIVKWEITDLDPAQLTATTSEGESQTDTLSENANPTPPTVVQPENSSADFIIAYGAVPYWDYYLTNYDDEGNVRTEPSKTTFNLSGEEDSDVPAYYSAAAEISSEGTGKVVIQFAYESAEDKAWFDAAAKKGGDVQLVAFNENKTPLNKDLEFTKSTDTSETTSQTVGTITISLDQNNFRSNGRYYVRITSADHDTALVPIHVVNKTAPSMGLVEPGALESGKNIHFTVEDMTYGITVPIDSVELTRPGGQTVQLEKIRDWYLLGDSFILYNDEEAENGRNNIPYKGEYTLTVHSTGFKDMTYKFTVAKGEEAPSAASNFGVDALSSATIVGGDSSEGGGGAISAYLKFDVDLLANALLLDEIDMANDAAQGIADRWNHDITAPDTIHTGDGTAYSFSAFRDAINKAQTDDNKYLTFGEYIKEAGKDQTGTPYAIKTVLEDNLLGETQNGGTWIGMTPPALTLVDEEGTAVDAVLEGSDLILTTDDSDYFKALESITINDNALPLDKDDYTISEDGKTLTIPADNLTLGEANKVVLYADGYKANTLSIRYNKDLENITGLKLNKSSYKRGENVQITVEGSKGDFLENLTGVTVTLPDNSQQTVFTKSAGGGDYYYTVNGNVLTIVDPDGELFCDNGEYSVSLSAQYYKMQKTDNFQVTGELKPTPQVTITGTVDDDNNLTLNFSEEHFSWRNAITSIAVNDNVYAKYEGYSGTPGDSEYSWSQHAGGIDGSYDLYLDNQKITDGPNTIVIKSKGYEPLTLTVNISGSSVTVEGGNESTEEPPAPAEQEPPAVTGSGYDGMGALELRFGNSEAAKSYLSNGSFIVLVNNTTYAESEDPYWLNDEFYVYEDGNSISLSDSAFSEDGSATITIKADGYKDLTITIGKDGSIV